MTGFAFVTAGPIEQITGGYIYDRRMVEGLRTAGRAVEVLPVAGRHPEPDEAASADAAAKLGALPQGSVLVIDGLAGPALVPSLAARQDLRAILLCHHPLGVETGLDAATAARLAAAERAVLALCRGAICPSPASAAAVVEMGVPAERVIVVPPGLDRAEPNQESAGDGPVRLLSIGTVTPRKGHVLLIGALARLADRPWSLTIVGSLERDPETVTTLRATLAAAGFGDRVMLAGEHPPGTLGAAYAAADIFVLPSFHEGYGMVYAEAMAHGLPIIGTTAGAIPETVPPSAGILVPPGDAPALAAALVRLIDDPALRRSYAAGGWAAARAIPDWGQASAAFGAAVDTILARERIAGAGA